jgi:hypothetical protein
MASVMLTGFKDEQEILNLWVEISIKEFFEIKMEI